MDALVGYCDDSYFFKQSFCNPVDSGTIDDTVLEWLFGFGALRPGDNMPAILTERDMANFPQLRIGIDGGDTLVLDWQHVFRPLEIDNLVFYQALIDKATSSAEDPEVAEFERKQFILGNNLMRRYRIVCKFFSKKKKKKKKKEKKREN